MKTSIACIGLGTIGYSWAAKFASAGNFVKVYDESANTLETGFRSAQDIAGWLVNNSGGACDQPGTILKTTSLDDALEGVSYIQESITENLEAKRNLFYAISKHADETAIVGSSTSQIPGSAFMTGLSNSSRCLVVHPINPPALIPLVELCATPKTSDETVQAVRQLMLDLGQVPIDVCKEVSGYVANRLQAALIREALNLVEDGVCSATDVDRAIEAGLGLRWALMGPFETGHLNSSGGYADYMRKYRHTYYQIMKDLRVDNEWPETLFDSIHGECATALGGESISSRQAWRDEMLSKLLRLKTDGARRAWVDGAVLNGGGQE